jgi:hypothetical protein
MGSQVYVPTISGHEPKALVVTVSWDQWASNADGSIGLKTYSNTQTVNFAPHYTTTVSTGIEATATVHTDLSLTGTVTTDQAITVHL